MAIEIRNVRSSDLGHVLALNEAAVPNVNRVDMPRMRLFRDAAAYFRVALLDDELAGFLIGLTPEADYESPNFRWFCQHYDDFAYVDRIAVAEEARRCGIAAALYGDFEAVVAAKRPRLVCEVNLRPPNEGSMRFHQRLGFRQVGSQVIDGGEKEVAMLVREIR